MPEPAETTASRTPALNWSNYPPPRVPTPQNAAGHPDGFRLYVAGPMSGLQDFNRPMFHRVARTLRAVGFRVLNPADTDLGDAGEWVDYMRLGINQVTAVDGIATLDGWPNSKGATLEVNIARALGIPDEPWARWIEKGL